MLEQNHAVFGRRGAGKSTLFKSLINESINLPIVPLLIDLEEFKDIPFPDIVIKVLLSIITALDEALRKQASAWNLLGKFGWHPIFFELKSHKQKLSALLMDPEEYVEDSKRRTQQTSKSALASTLHGVEANLGGERSTEEERQRQVKIKKIDILRKYLTDYKSLVKKIAAYLHKDLIYILFDDFYFIPKTYQPEFIDYFHRLSKDSRLKIKLATIKNRTLLSRPGDPFIGVELNHDILPIDLDYTMDDFPQVTSFMDLILNQLYVQKNCSWVKGYFAGEGYHQLCLASGGVPRDFLALYQTLLQKIDDGSIEQIGKVEVTEAAISNAQSKRDALQRDSGEEVGALETFLNAVVTFVVRQSKTNSFLVSKDHLNQFPKERQALRELTDLRFWHLVDSNTSSAPGMGKRYEAYIVDPGLYPNTRPRNFQQIDLSQITQKSSKDQLRASPRLDLRVLNQQIGPSLEPIQGELFPDLDLD